MRFGNVMNQLAALFGAGLLAVGCSSNPQVRDGGNWPDQPNKGDGTVVVDTTPAPAPRPEPRPQPAPAPVYAGSGSIAAFPTGHTRTPQLLVERQAPAQVRLGEPFEYQYTLTNTTDSTMTDIELVEQISSHFQVISSEPAQSGAGTWSIPTLAPGESTVVRVTGRATSAEAVNSCAEARYRVPLCDTVEVVEPALAVLLEGPAEALLCDCYNLRVEVRNTGSGTAENVQVVVTLPAGVKTQDGNSSVTLAAGNLASGERKESFISVCAENRGSFTANANATSGQLTASSNAVTTAIRQPVLAINCSAPGTMFVGRDAPVSITVSNTGDAASNNTVVRYTVPAGATVSDLGGGTMQGGQVVWSAGSLAAGGSSTYNLRISPNGIGNFQGTAEVSGDCATAVSCPLATTVQGIPAILLEVVDIADPVLVGENTTYVITVTNQGSADDTNIRLVHTLESEQSFVSASGATAGTAAGQQVTFAPLARLAPGAVAEWRVTVRANAVGSVRFFTTMSSDNLTRPVEETEATNQYE